MPAPRWSYSFESSERLRVRAEEREQAGDRGCVRADYCAGRTVRLEDGKRILVPAKTYQAFCPADVGVIGTSLGELPPAYIRLHLEISEPSRGNATLRSPFGPRLPLRADIDALMRSIAEVLVSWEERVREVARLSMLDTELSRHRRTGKAVVQSARIIGDRLGALLALPAAPMVRAVPVAGEPDSIEIRELSGADAGLEVLRLHRSALTVLGEIVRRAEELQGVPCRNCEEMTLVRAEPPSDPKSEAMWSHCTRCRNELTRDDFTAWAKMYARWAESAGMPCKRCQAGNCGLCQWPACSCKASDHSLAA